MHVRCTRRDRAELQYTRSPTQLVAGPQEKDQTEHTTVAATDEQIRIMRAVRANIECELINGDSALRIFERHRNNELVRAQHCA